MTSKIHIKMGAIEVDFEGSEEFLRDELPRIIASVSELHRQAPAPEPAPGPGDNASLAPALSDNGATGLRLTTGSIAAKLNVKSGAELILAAAARLALIDKKDTYTRQELLTEMKTAAGYYKTTYNNNLSAYLQTLVKDGKLVETATNTFALAAPARADMSSKVAA